MKREVLDIEIMPDGRVQVTVKGRKGKSCLEVLDFFKEFLGPVENTVHTDEYYESENVVCIDERVKRRRG